MAGPLRGRLGAPILVALVAGLAVSSVGCGSGEDAAVSEPALLELDAPLRDPVYSPEENAAFALREDGEDLVKIEVEFPDIFGNYPRAVTREKDLEEPAAENLALKKGMFPDEIYLPIPRREEIQVIENDDMNEVLSFDAGEDPARVAYDGGSGTVFVLSGDGRTVTAVNGEDYEKIAEVETEAGEGAFIEAARGGEGPAFWLAGPNGVAFYPGLSAEDRATLPANAGTNAGALAADATNPGRAYVAESGTGRVLALETGPAGRLEVAAEADLGEEVAYLSAEEGALYAATADELVALDPEGLDTLGTTEFTSSLEGKSLGGATLSGMAVTGEGVYLTLRGEPYMLLVEKPS